jgi:HK97 family phage major capsid protein
VAPTLTVPRNADELEEMLGDTSNYAKIAETPDTFKNFILDYAKNQATSDPTIAQQIKDETQRQFAEILRNEQLDGINRLNLAPDGTPVARSKHYNAKAPGAKLDRDKRFGNWADYLSNIWQHNQSGEAHSARSDITKLQNSLGSTVPSDGGFLIPEYLRSELLRVSLETALVRPRARVIPMETLTVPFPTIDSTSNASSVHGGIVGYWTEEGGALTDSSPKFGRVNLMAKKLTVYAEVPNELFQDSLISLQAFMDEAYPEAISWFEDVAFVNGTGVGEPLGFLNAAAAVSVAKETNQNAGTILWENIVKAYSRMLPSSIGRAVWVCHIDTFPELATMALSVGTGGSAVWIGNGDGAGAPPMTILGRPVVFTEKVSSVGTAGDVNFVDFGYYLIGDRQAMQAATSVDYKFGNDKTAMRVIERVDGRPWIQSAIQPQTGSNTLSPFVKIATR